MRKIVSTLLLCLLFASASWLHAADCSTMAGSVPVVIPSPGKEFTEVGSDKRDSFEWVVPSRNRLLCAFVPADFLPSLKNPATGMGQYMLVEVSRQLEEKNAEVTSAIFEKIVAGTKQQVADSSTLNQTTETTSEEIRNKLKHLDQSKDVSIDKPTPLGTLFQTSDAYGFAMLVPVSSAGVTTRAINASVLLRVRERLIFAYLYGGSEDKKTLQWIASAAEQWANEILAANSKSTK